MGKLRSIPFEPPLRGTTSLALGDLTMVLSDPGVDTLHWRGVELLRGIAYPIRDADWGTIPTQTEDEQLSSDGQSASYIRDFSSVGGGFAGRLTLEASAEGRVTLDVDMVAGRRQTVTRAGFTLLHPILLAGRALTVVHSDGTVEKTSFPELISPSQAARDIAGLRYEIEGISVAIDMQGDIFEMEDQRNWSDASYKTYCRPLWRPFPYEVQKGHRIHQRLEISIHGGTVPVRKTRPKSPALQIRSEALSERLPSVALVSEAGWHHDLPGGLDEVRRIARVDLRTAGWTVPSPANAPVDLELITADTLDLARAQLQGCASALSEAKLVPEHVIALPGAYLKSYQPDGRWPPGARPFDIVAAARAAFPKVRIGGGMLTNFTELNRCRPDPALLDYITHGTSAIVHAADDVSVFQTIEALPQVFASGRSIAQGRPYRLGLVSIGMRTNPYGAGLADNPEGLLRTMTADDPRARSLVGAAWMVAAMAATEEYAIHVIALAAPAGPFGIVDRETGALRPSFHVIRGLSGMGGLPRVRVETGDPTIHAVAALADETVRVVVANGSATDKRVGLPGGAAGAVLDLTALADAAATPAWMDDAARPLGSQLPLPPYAVAFLSLSRPAERAP